MTDPKRFAGKAALVTGAATGIGRATALALGREGAAVMIGDVSEGAADTVAAIESEGGRAAFRLTDVSERAQVERLVAECVERFGGLHLAFNNAGVLPPSVRIHEIDPEDYRRVMRVDVDGVFWSMRAELAHMLAHGGGAIVNTASIAAMIAHPGISPYIAAKHAVAGLTRSAAIEYVRDGIRVNAICPGFVRTPMTEPWFTDEAFLEAFQPLSPAGRAAEPEEVVGTVLHLLSNEASFINGSLVVMDGGQTAI